MFEFEVFSSIGGFEKLDSSKCYIKYASPKDTHGPVVKTGPTAGQNRSRNKDGRWRKNVMMREKQRFPRSRNIV